MSLARWNALIRTHHITSRKKVARLKQAAADNDVLALLRSGGAPGIMYVEGMKADVEAWVAAVQKLRYKDYHLAVRPSELAHDLQSSPALAGSKSEPGSSTASEYTTGLHEIDTVKDFGAVMQQRRLWHWWRKGMGYEASEGEL